MTCFGLFWFWNSLPPKRYGCHVFDYDQSYCHLMVQHHTITMTEVTQKHKGKQIVKRIFDKSSACISALSDESWLSGYPRTKSVIYDNGSKFKCTPFCCGRFCEDVSLVHKPTANHDQKPSSEYNQINCAYNM